MERKPCPPIRWIDVHSISCNFVFFGERDPRGQPHLGDRVGLVNVAWPTRFVKRRQIKWIQWTFSRTSTEWTRWNFNKDSKTPFIKIPLIRKRFHGIQLNLQKFYYQVISKVFVYFVGRSCDVLCVRSLVKPFRRSSSFSNINSSVSTFDQWKEFRACGR